MDLAEPATDDAVTTGDRPLLRLIESLTRPLVDAAAPADDAHYRRFLDALGVALYMTDATGRITYFNDAAAELWGRRPALGEEWCGSWRLFWPDGRPMAHADCPMAITLRDGQPARGFRAIAERPDGTRVDFEPHPSPLRDPDGLLVGAVNVLVDVSERERAQDDLRQSEAALQASTGVREDFMSLVSHELRTPVTTILGNAQLLQSRGDRLASDIQAGMISDIAEDADRLHAIIENLLLFTRLRSGIRPETEPQVLTHVVRQVVGGFDRRYPDRRFHLTVPPQHIVVDAERTQLALVLENLLSNANKYGGPTAGIDVVVRIAGDDAEVVVLDRGLGFGDVEQATLFEPFYRSEDAQKRASGMGLGLPVCDRIVTAIGGRLWALPREGGGSEFGFAIPLAQEPDPAS
ncbi:MAG: ATP-binding protein [Candidatus Limnocylindrales bacterium]